MARGEIPDAEKIRPPCVHALTVASDWPRWRRCMECNHLVHQSQTEHFARLAR